MRLTILPLLVSALFSPFLHAQAVQPAAPAATQLHCSIQPAPAASDARTALVGGDFAKAEVLYSAQISASPTAASYAGLVRVQLQANKLPEAMATAQAAATALPTSALAQDLLGDVYLRSGQFAQAADTYKKALTLDPCSARGHFGIARIYTMTGHPALADREFARARALSPDPEILAAYLLTLPSDKRTTPLQAFFATQPQLPPDQLQSLATQLALLEQNAFCTPTEPITRIKLTLDPVMFNGTYIRSWGLKTRLNNADTPLLELDSSVSGIVLNQRDAAKAGIRPLTTASANSPYTAIADHVHVGSLDYRNCPVRVLPDLALGKANSLIGLDFFRDHLIRIDYADQSLTLAPFPSEPGSPTDLGALPETPTNKAWQPVVIADGNVLITTYLSKKGPYLFALDTGVGRTILSPPVSSSVLGNQVDSSVNLQGTSSTIVKVVPKTGGSNVDLAEVYGPDGKFLPVKSPVKLAEYYFGGNEFPDPRAVAFDLSPKSHVAGIEVSGLLGFGVLQGFMLEINYRDALARILFDQNRRYAVNQANKHYLGNYY